MDILNYIWLSDKYFYDPEKFLSRAPIPAEYLNNAIRTAKENPEVEVYVWSDLDKMSANAKDFFIGLKALPRNLSFKNLSEVREYREDTLFHNSDATIWQKCDLVRLIVVSHLLSDKNNDTVYYSDFDILLPNISSNDIQDRLKRRGLVFYSVSGSFENGFFGINNSHKRNALYLKNTLIPSTRKSYEDYPFSYGENGWLPFCKAAQVLCGRGNLKLLDAKILNKYALPLDTLSGTGSCGGFIHFDPKCLVEETEIKISTQNETSLVFGS